MKRNVLGKGIAAIISNEPTIPQSKLQEIEIDRIYPNPHQPRKQFSEDKIKELADSMKESGMIQPVVVYCQDERYYLIVGERRWRAAQLLQWEKIPAVIRDYSENEIVIDSLVENIQRENLNSLEIANGIDSLASITGFNHQQISEKLGMSRVAVTNFLRLLKLPDPVKELVVDGRLDQGHARALLGMELESDMVTLAKEIVKKDMSVRQVEHAVKKRSQEKESSQSRVDPDMEKMENRLTRLFSTKVTLNYRSSGKGTISIFFESLDEFQRVFSMLTKEKEQS